MLYNNQSPYTAALIVPNKDAIKRFVQGLDLSLQTDEGQAAVLKLLEAEILAYRQGGNYAGEFPERWLPSAIAVLGEGFTEQNRFLNSTLKMVRGRITEFYKDRIEYMFTAEGKNVCNYQNKMIMKRLGE